MKANPFYILIILLLSLFSCKKDTTYKKHLSDPELYLATAKQLTDVIVYDIFSPPVASRVYAYPNIAAYETMIHAYPDKYVSLAGQLSGLKPPPQPKQQNIDFHLASLQAFLKVGKTLIFSEEKMDTYSQALYKKMKDNGISKTEFNNSIAYGDIVAQHIIDWADKDMYKQTRSYPKYTIVDKDSLWKPTPPDYMSGIEPHWNKIRTMVLKSPRQFPSIPPVKFDLEESSEFYNQLKEVYDIGIKLDDEQKTIASFWDCNPYVSHHRGHAMFATKKITPGGHWMGISAIASRKANNSFDETIETHTKVSIALFDAFISCWDEKWRSLMVRPETLINEHIDEDWLPLLQTPPFPEYTSGHSVISRSAAVMLTEIYKDGFAFKDTVEVEYDLPSRDFKSFLHASEEAAISRLYGGIHYRMAIDNGVTQGHQVGEYIANNIQTRVAK